MKTKSRLLIAILGLCLWGPPITATQVTGAGSSFVYPLLARWADNYQKATQQEINYQSIGSGGGLNQLKHDTIDFAAVDMPQSRDTLMQNQWVQFPIAIGGLVVSYHIPGIASNRLRLTGAVLGDIYLGKITRWNDPALRALNPDLALPNRDIVVIHRADGSGTTYNFTQYLSANNPTWAKTIGSATEVDWPAGIGAKGNNGVAMSTERVPNSISYLEYSFIKLTGLPTAVLQNPAGYFLAPTAETFQAAADHANWQPSRHYQQLLINQPGANSWPMVATTFVLLPKNRATNAAVLHFFLWGLIHDDASVLALDYVPLPSKLLQSLRAYWQDQLSVTISDT